MNEEKRCTRTTQKKETEEDKDDRIHREDLWMPYTILQFGAF
jgi:hypothetical protein